jgi:hypothetical protein
MNIDFLTINENDFIDKQGRILFTFENDDSDVDDVFKFVTKPITLYHNVIIRKDLNVYDINKSEKKILKYGSRVPIVKEIFRGIREKQGLYFIIKENVYFIQKGKY